MYSATRLSVPLIATVLVCVCAIPNSHQEDSIAEQENPRYRFKKRYYNDESKCRKRCDYGRKCFKNKYGDEWCACPPNTRCDQAINNCQPNPCFNKGQCVNGEGYYSTYSCSCTAGYTGQRCETPIDLCMIKNPCINGATCTTAPTGTYVICTCVPGYIGPNCQIDINDCSPNPCQNGATCVDKVNGYECICPTGFIGDDCETDIDDCVSFPCLNGICEDQANKYTCTCSDGYKDPICGTICSGSWNYVKNTKPSVAQPALVPDANTLQLCQQACITDPNCVAIIFYAEFGPCGTYNFISDDLEDDPSWTFIYYLQLVKKCPDNDLCTTRPCQNDGTCINVQNGYKCVCAEGFTGENCENEISGTTTTVVPP